MATNSSSSTYGLLCFARGGGRSSAQITGQPFMLPEMHLNIWEQEPNKGVKSPDSLLDIGLMLDVRDQTTSIELIFPTKVRLTSVVDLSSTVSQPQAIPAIFNESWAVVSMGTQGTDAVVFDPAQSDISFAIVSTNGAISETQYAGHDALSISVPQLIKKAKAVSHNTQRPIVRVYVRFRVLEFKREFYCVGTGERGAHFWQPSWQRTEDIDFRLNVRRGAPAGLERSIGQFIEFSKVHLFLMRSRDKDIVFQDKLFKASRSLEDEAFWAQYSIVGTAMSAQANLERVKNSLGYHWKSGNPGPVKEFGTLARFKVVEFGVGKFVAIALLVGVLGNMVYDSLKEGGGWLYTQFFARTEQKGSTSSEAAKALLVAPVAEPKPGAKAVNQKN